VARSKSRKQLIRELNESMAYFLEVLEQIVFHKNPRIPERREYSFYLIVNVDDLVVHKVPRRARLWRTLYI
jgi:hypothetical protein